jgi:Fe(3+) dicitrate transport protein
MKLHKLASMLASTSITLSAFADDHGGKDYLSPFNVIGTKADVQTLQGSGTILNSTDLDYFMHTDITEILRQVPGVYVRPEEGYGLFPNISLRGVDPSRSQKVTILEDGIPASPSPFSGPAAYYSPTAGRMAGFEILKGSSSLKYGPNNSGGVINYLSTPIPVAQTSKLRGSYGDFNERVAHAYSGGTVDFADGKLGFLLEVFDHRTDGWKTIANDTTTGGVHKSGEAPIYKNDMLFKLSYEFGEGNYLEFKAGKTDLDGDVSYLGVTKADFKANPYQRYTGTRHDNMDSDQTRYYLRYLKEINDTTKLTAAIFSNEFNRDWYKISKVDGNSVGEGVLGNANNVAILKGETNGDIVYKHNDRTYETQGIQANLEFELSSHMLDLGFRYTNDDYTYNPGYTEDTYSMSTITGLSLASSTGLKNTKSDTYMESDALEIYLLDEFSLGALTLTPGIRYTSVDYFTHGGGVYLESDGTNVHTDTSLSTTLLGIGATYELGSNILFAGVHQGQALPGPKTKGLKNEETSLGFEIGLRNNEESSFAYQVAYFNTAFEDMFVYPSSGSGSTTGSQVGEVDTSGLEILLAKDFGNDSIGVPLQFALTYTKAEYGTSMNSAKDDAEDRYDNATEGNKIPFIPELQFNVRGGLVFDKLSTYLNYHWQDEVYVNGSNTREITDFDATIPGYGVIDWSGFYEIKDGVTAFAKVTNLGDEVYTMSDLPDGYRPGAPRIWSIGMEFDF